MVLVKPNVKELKQIYSGLLKVSSSARIEALAKAFAWYDAAYSYGMAKKLTTAEGLKKLDKANKLRELGISSEFIEERESAFHKSIQQYEQVVPFLNPPAIEEFYTKLKEMREKLEKEETRLLKRYQPILDIFVSVFQVAKFKFKIDPRAEKQRMFNGIDELIYGEEAMKLIHEKIDVEGVLSAVTSEIPFIARAMSLETGYESTILNPKKQIEAMTKLTENFVSYARINDFGKFKLLRAGSVPEIAVQAPGEQKKDVVEEKPKTKFATSDDNKRSRGEGTLKKKTYSWKEGKYDPAKPLSSMFEKLKKAGSISEAELFKDYPGPNPQAGLSWLQIHGGKNKLWTVTKSKGIVSIKMHGG